MNKIYLKRLLKLRKIIKSIPNNNFYMGHWYNCDKVRYGNKPIYYKCGTTACMLGWACLDKGFKRAGLKLTNEHYPEFTPTTKFDKKQNPYKLSEGEAGGKFFGLTWHEENDLFYNYNKNKSQMLKVLDGIIKTRLKENKS